MARASAAVPRVGISACFFHADPERAIFKGKTLLYNEESMIQYVMSGGGFPVMVPRECDEFPLPTIVAQLHGLVLHGGSDVAPASYGERELSPKWPGDRPRDLYEMALVRECIQQGVPVFGICRGMQIMNVALGGTLYQDIQTQVPAARTHRDWQVYDELAHEVTLTEGGKLSALYGKPQGRVNSVHHQGVKDLAPGLVVEATSVEDGIVEAVRSRDPDGPWVVGVQWHPEFQAPSQETSETLSPKVLLQDFMAAVRKRMDARP